MALPLSGLRSPDSPKHSSTLTAGHSQSGRLWGPWDHLLEACSNLGPLCSDLWGAPRLLTRSGSCHSPGPHLHQCYWPLAGHFLPLGQTPACTLRGRETVGRHRRRLSPQGARRPSPRPPGTPGTARSSRARARRPRALACDSPEAPDLLGAPGLSGYPGGAREMAAVRGAAATTRRRAPLRRDPRGPEPARGPHSSMRPAHRPPALRLTHPSPGPTWPPPPPARPPARRPPGTAPRVCARVPA